MRDIGAGDNFGLGILKKGDHCIFDADGTLVDTTELGKQKIRRVLELSGLPKVSDAFLRAIWGKPIGEVYKLVGIAVGATDEQIELFYGMGEQLKGKYLLNMDVLDMLLRLRKKGVILSLITNRTTADLPEVTENIGLPLAVFNFTQTTDDWPYCKPDHRVFSRLDKWLRMNAFSPENTIYFGDTVDCDYMAVKSLPYRHNIKFVGVASGISTADDFFRAEGNGSDIIGIVDGVSGLPEFVSGLLRKNSSMHSHATA